ncbi:MAG: hypothetical protein HQM10_14300 [Candidatus Riflebacteria bacterium]|nr:hypothetical protein [Candidatus Riflebacteria bacterium]
MNKILYFLCIFLLSNFVEIYAMDVLENSPEFVEFGQKFYRGEETLQLYVPKSFEGRSAKENRKIYGVELFNGFRFERIDSDFNLKGRSSVFDFESKKDSFDYQIFNSKAVRPSDRSCMECHCGKSRTTAFMGYETQALEAKPLQRGGIQVSLADVLQKSWHVRLGYWLSERYHSAVDFRTGSLVGGRICLKADTSTLLISGFQGHRFFWDSRFSVSKTESYPAKKFFGANISYKFGRRLKLLLGGGIFFDGVNYFGTEMSELGSMVFALEKSDPDMLPALYQRLRSEKFGYYKSSIIYEYPF